MIKIDPSWIPILHLDMYNKIIKTNNIIASKSKLLLPFTFFKLNQLKIVILGEEPYPNPDYSTGLAFSINKSNLLPQSLKNIFKEINLEYNNKYNFVHGDLTKWASREKILLLNTSLTNDRNISHKKYWRKYTDLIIKEISDNTNNICFVLMGNHAKDKKHLINSNKHCILECIHPSPNSASRGFFGSNIFKKIEEYVGKVNWQN
jgi:uracil-DNA glycosylase